VGFDLLQAAARAVGLLQTRLPVVLQAFTGPFMAAEQTAALTRMARTTIRFERFSEDFSAWLQAADASVSMAGYNTCMNILATRAKALVHPFDQNREQGMRARRLAAGGTLEVLMPPDLAPERLAERLTAMFKRTPSPSTVNLDGAARTAQWMEKLAGLEGRP
jgi:predicted glycosyltransferase